MHPGMKKTIAHLTYLVTNVLDGNKIEDTVLFDENSILNPRASRTQKQCNSLLELKCDYDVPLTEFWRDTVEGEKLMVTAGTLF